MALDIVAVREGNLARRSQVIILVYVVTHLSTIEARLAHPARLEFLDRPWTGSTPNWPRLDEQGLRRRLPDRESPQAARLSVDWPRN